MGVMLAEVWDRQPVTLMVMARFWDLFPAVWRQQHPMDTLLGRCVKLLALVLCPVTQPSSWLDRTTEPSLNHVSEWILIHVAVLDGSCCIYSVSGEWLLSQ